MDSFVGSDVALVCRRVLTWTPSLRRWTAICQLCEKTIDSFPYSYLQLACKPSGPPPKQSPCYRLAGVRYERLKTFKANLGMLSLSGLVQS